MDPEKLQSAKAYDATVETTSLRSDVFSLSSEDPALSSKMHLVNDAIDEIGFTSYHTKLFILTGAGYAVDSLILLLQSIVAGKAALEFNPGWRNGLTVAVYVGMLIGALFWGLGADVIGRKIAFNTSLFICSIFAIVAGASPNWIVLGTFVAISAFGAGGNLVLDTAVFLEYLPSRQQWMLTLMASYWGIGQLIAGLSAWAFIPNYSGDCTTVENCTYDNNKGWRYVWYSCGALVFVLSLLRVFVIRLQETPKYLLGKGKDEEVVKLLQSIATKHNRPCRLTLAHLQSCGEIATAHSSKRFSFSEIGVHLRGLFVTKKFGINIILIWFSWTLIGLAYPLYNVFLPDYLATRGADFGETSQSVYWRNYALSNFSSIFGPMIAAALCEVRYLGRRGTMVIGALITCIFFFCYTQVRTNAQNVGFTCAISACLNIYYGTLYAYTPEIIMSAHRTTGNGIAVGLNRIMGIVSAIVATYANTATSIPIYVCAGLFVALALVAGVMPYDAYGKRSI